MAIKPKILFLIPSLACGGTEKVISTLINHWDGEKFDILLGVNSKEIPFYPITNTAVSITIFGKSRVRYTWIMLLKLIWEERPDYIFSVLDFTRLMILLKPLIPTSCKLIARESNYLFEWLNTPQKMLSQYLYSNIDLLVVQSALMEQHIIQYLPEIAPRTLVIPNPIDTALVRKLAQMPLEYNLPNCPVFITIARLDTIKGHLRILEALTLLDFPFCYFIVGEGQERETIEAYIKQHQLESKVVLTGELKNPFPLLKSAHIYLQGSYSEAFPNVILEALCLGITPIAFAISGGTSEIIHSGENGFLANDVTSFTKSILEVLANPISAQKLLQNLPPFELNTVMSIYEKLFTENNK
ncbi:glycosyltransferase [Flectobacillus roseus]|uniref:Glycosyltransferase n=1 Tax=Flectobacillus roseus TaxID=502259 RepID=A0ABT6Y9G2_9BACT|nr:glycosyltransferase [Flectobacillus roseus]MDI9860228.1 glycosyltransferase [Flectobacillus roseus]